MEEKLNIGLFIDTFYPMIDGVINVVDNYARRLNQFANVTVFAPKARKNTFDDSTLPYKVVRCKRMNCKWLRLDYDLPLPALDRKFKKAIKDANLDIIHIHSPFTIGKLATNYGKKHNIPVVATMHSQYKKDFYTATKNKMLTNFMLKKILKVFDKCDECWAVNSEMSKVFKEYGVKEMPGVQNNGTDLVPFTNLQEIVTLKQKYGIKDDEKVLLFIGRICALKNIFFTVDSLAVLKQKGFKFKMLFVGTGQDEKKLKDQIKKLGLQNDVIFTGKITGREEISKYYKMADLFVFPSLYDASSLVQIEAASQSTPTVFIRGAATAATVTENVNGYLSDNSVEAFADKILEIFSDEQKYNQICSNAFRDLYVTWDDAVKKTYNDYLRIINEVKNKNERKG